MDNPERAWSAIVRRQNCSLTGSLRFPRRVFMGISRKSDFASGKCYQALQDGVRYTDTIASIIFGQHGGPVEGIAPNCRGLVLSIYEDLGEGKVSFSSHIDLARAITRAVEIARKFADAIVVNISGGELSQSGTAHPILTEVIQKYSNQDVLFVASAGNHGCDCLNVPGSLPSVLAVGAMNEHGEPLDFSNWGHRYRTQGVLAPGANILGAVPQGGTEVATGTSFATAIVSGIAALFLSLQQRLGQSPNPLAVREAILQSAKGCDSDQTEDDCKKYLAGRLNVRGALNIIKGEFSKMSIQPSLEGIEKSIGPASARSDTAPIGIPLVGARNQEWLQQIWETRQGQLLLIIRRQLQRTHAKGAPSR